MSIEFNSSSVEHVRVNDGTTLTPASITIVGGDVYVRSQTSDYPSGGTSQIRYAWYCATALSDRKYCYTVSQTPAANDPIYYSNGVWYTIIDSYAPPQAGYANCFAITFNGQGVWAVERKLYLDYNAGMVLSVDVSITAVGYNPQHSVGALTQTYDSEKSMYYVIVSPGDVLNIVATPSAGHRITGGTGSYTVTSDSDEDIVQTISATYENLEISGQLYDMYNSAMVLETIEYISIKNNFNSSAAISSISGCKIFVLDSPYTIGSGQTVSFQAKKNADLVPATGNYYVTARSSKGDFTGLIQSSHT